MTDFPADFLWGSSTAAHQVEGGNANNDWWQWEHTHPAARQSSPLETASITGIDLTRTSLHCRSFARTPTGSPWSCRESNRPKGNSPVQRWITIEPLSLPVPRDGIGRLERLLVEHGPLRRLSRWKLRAACTVHGLQSWNGFIPGRRVICTIGDQGGPDSIGFGKVQYR
jgi:hypothetical protein